MIWTGMLIVVLFYLSTTLANIILFVPRHSGNKDWVVMSKHTTAMIHDIANIQGVVGCVTDIYILIIPIHLVIGLRLPVRKKLGVFAIFITGFACVTSISSSPSMCLFLLQSHHLCSRRGNLSLCRWRQGDSRYHVESNPSIHTEVKRLLAPLRNFCDGC